MISFLYFSLLLPPFRSLPCARSVALAPVEIRPVFHSYLCLFLTLSLAHGGNRNVSPISVLASWRLTNCLSATTNKNQASDIAERVSTPSLGR